MDSQFVSEPYGSVEVLTNKIDYRHGFCLRTLRIGRGAYLYALTKDTYKGLRTLRIGRGAYPLKDKTSPLSGCYSLSNKT